MNSLKFLYSSMAAVAFSAGLSHAAVSITFDEVGSDVVASYSGSVNLASMDFTSQTAAGELHGYDGNEAYFQNTGTGTVTVGFTNFIASPSFVTASGAGPQTTISFAGDDFGLRATTTLNQVYLPAAYISETEISGSLTFAGETISSLGLNPGSYQWQWTDSGGTVIESATLTVVPEPSSIGLAGLGLMGFLLRRRR